MPAHTPRRLFAQSFVVTLAVLPACGADTPVAQNPPEPTPIPTTEPSATASATPAPTASIAADPSAPTDAATWAVTRTNGHCFVELVAACPPNAKCNPPGPAAYDCPSAVSATATRITITRAAGQPLCRLETAEYFSDGSCPRGAHCNPPPPRYQKMDAPCPK